LKFDYDQVLTSCELDFQGMGTSNGF